MRAWVAVVGFCAVIAISKDVWAISHCSSDYEAVNVEGYIARFDWRSESPIGFHDRESKTFEDSIFGVGSLIVRAAHNKYQANRWELSPAIQHDLGSFSSNLNVDRELFCVTWLYDLSEGSWTSLCR